MKPLRIALFAPGVVMPPNVYLDQLFGLKRGFEKAGVETYVGTQLLDPQVLKTFIRHYHPDVLLEINRTRSKLPELPRSITHVAWIQDYRFQGELLIGERSQSDVTFFIIEPTILGYQYDGHQGVLSPGVNEAVFFPEELKTLSDFSFLGYIPSPITEEERSRLLIADDAEKSVSVSFGQVVDGLMGRPEMLQGNFDYWKIHAAIHEVVENLTGKPLAEPLPQEVLGFFDERLVRILERRAVLQALLRVSTSFRIFGPNTWKSWPDFEPYYGQYLDDQADMRRVFQSTCVNLHSSGLGMHFRVLDCMASGGVVLVNETPRQSQPGGLAQHFEPGGHYVPYTPGNVDEIARELLFNESRCKKIAKAAANEVLARHTWTHRAKQILSVLET